MEYFSIDVLTTTYVIGLVTKHKLARKKQAQPTL